MTAILVVDDDLHKPFSIDNLLRAVARGLPYAS